jgi:hypothetical protein
MPSPYYLFLMGPMALALIMCVFVCGFGICFAGFSLDGVGSIACRTFQSLLYNLLMV